MLSRTVKKERHAYWEKMKEQWMEELGEAWRCRNVHTANRLMRLLAGSKFGTKKRDYRLVQQALPSCDEWLEQLTKEGAMGGMKARQMGWKDMLAEHVACAPPLPPRDMNHISQGRQDVKLFEEYSIHA